MHHWLCCCKPASREPVFVQRNKHKSKYKSPVFLEEHRGEYDSHFGDASIGDLERLMTHLQRNVEKCPTGSKAIFRKSHDRYIAILPCKEVRDSDVLQRYQKGWLAYWESRNDYLKALTPRGWISLMTISKVSHDNSKDGRGVSIKHKNGDKTKDILFLFKRKAEAEEFSYVLWEFLARLRGEWIDGSPSILADVVT
mmetsp:Transcript_56512/g.89747  ORF Transcript_56512/g.89747 Transcript_56512/m.89747 type:complete len:197 (+) Transcript_56512:52-642(+)